MDKMLMQHFAKEFQEKNKGAPDPLKNKKALIRLEDAVGKTKKILSSNEEAPVRLTL
jgi:molecular chaperone DnaK (HSP70)